MSAPALKIENLKKTYATGVVALKGVSLDVPEGDFFALLGPNGAGKSTLVKMIYGLVKPDQGRMTWRGAAYAPPEPRAARASAGSTSSRAGKADRPTSSTTNTIR